MGQSHKGVTIATIRNLFLGAKQLSSISPTTLPSLRDGDVSKSTDLRQQAQRCFSFVDPKGLAEATDDVDAAVRKSSALLEHFHPPMIGVLGR